MDHSKMTRLTLDYVTKTARGTWLYRRVVAADLRAYIGKREIKKVIGKNEAQAIKAYNAFHAKVEADLAKARRKTKATAEDQATVFEDYQAALARLREWGIDPTQPIYSEPNEPSQRELLIEDMERRYGDNIPQAEAQVVQALAGAKRPQPTFEDAKRLYVTEKVAGDHNEIPRRQRADRVAGHIRAALGRDPAIVSLTKADARAVRDHMLADGGVSPVTVGRYLSDIKAIINYGIEHLEIEGAVNPFNKLTIKELEQRRTRGRDDRHPFTPEQLKDTRERIMGHPGVDLRLIWRLLEGTGCRLAECGLLVGDVVTEGPWPHLDLVFHDHRRLKGRTSVRKVPLVGDALAAAIEAKSGAVDGYLFKKYATGRGADSASQILMKHIRTVIEDRKVTNHSLRHAMEDKLILAGVSEYDRNAILGHTNAGIGDRYGSDQARLEATTKAMKVALDPK